jgi:hypothetical protein
MGMEAKGTDDPRLRRTSIALVVLASLVLFLGGFAVWAARQILNTDDWVETSSQLLEDEEIQAAVKTFLVDELFIAVDVQAQLEGALPPQLKPLAGPAAGGIRSLADQVAEKALASPKVQQLWVEANRASHEQMIAVVEGDDQGLLTATDGTVTLDLKSMIDNVGAQIGIDVGDKVPPELGQVEILQSDEITAAQDAANLLKKLAYGLILVSLAIYTLAIWLARGRRRQTVWAIGFAWIVVGIAILAIRQLAGDALVDQLASTAGVEPAIDATWRIGTSLLSASAAALIGYGIVTVLGAVLAGPSAIATSIRGAIAPLFHSVVAAYGLLLVLVLLVFLWAPTEGTQRLAPSLVLLILMIAGFEALRRKTVSDFPDASWAEAGTRWRERLSGAASGVRSHVPSRGGEADPHEERIARLERLRELHSSGVLSRDELEAEKLRIIEEEK